MYEATPVPSTLFGTSDPTLALERMALMARLLVDVVRDRKLVMKISGNEYLLAPGWAVLAGMTGLSPYTAWTRPLEDGTGYIARVEVRARRRRRRHLGRGAGVHALGAQVGEGRRARAHGDGADARLEPCSPRSAPADRRARGLQGHAGRGDGRGAEDDVVRADPRPAKPTKEQAARIRELIAELTAERPDVDWRERAQLIAGVPGNMLTKAHAAMVIAKLEADLDAEAAE